MLMSTVPNLPENGRDVVRALARAAFLFRGIFIQAAEGRPVPEILEEREAALELANQVLDLRLPALGIDPETGKEDVEAT
jgi:hypothetical protein